MSALRNMWAIGLAALALVAVPPASQAGSQHPALPPLAYPKASYFQKNPGAWAAFVAKLPQRPLGAPQVARKATKAPAFGGTWQAVTISPAVDGLCNPLLLTDGTVMLADCGSPGWWKLTPDITGSYANGTWSKLASLPVIGNTQYAPLYHASAVLPDGRVIIMGGEYNNFVPVWTNLGAIYDPVANTWTPVAAPPGKAWNLIGDAQSAVLPNGTFMLAACCAYPDADALFNPTTLGWTTTGAPSAAGGYQDEQGYNLMPNGNVLTVDIWTNYPTGNANNAERYLSALGTWVSAGNTPVSLVDPITCGNFEIGPAVLRPNGTVVYFGGNTGCVSGNSADPTAIYDSNNISWNPGPYVPAACGGLSCDLADAPAALLPNGNVLFAASPGYGNSPTHFFEFSAANAINQVSDPLYYASTSGAYYYNLLVLPNGQILMTDFSDNAEVYTPLPGGNSSWAPQILSAPSVIAGGGTYRLSGLQLNGLSTGAAYGDDVQMETNYPIVQITNLATGHVFYARTFNHSTMSVAPRTFGSTNFTVPRNIELGASKLVVIANGIASQPQRVMCVQ